MSETTLGDEETKAALAEIREVMRADPVRVEFDTVFSLSRGALHCVRFFVPGPTPRSKWRQVGMRMIAPEGQNSRLGMIQHLQDLYGPDDTDA